LTDTTTKSEVDFAAIQLAQLAWSNTPVARRVQIISRFRVLLADNAASLAAKACQNRDRDPTEVVIAEALPLAEGCRFLEKNSKKILNPVRLSAFTRPRWLVGLSGRITREPHGIILILAPFNYPLFLPGIQALQALAAGNAVIVKPGTGGGDVMLEMAKLLADAGLPEHLFNVTGDSVESGVAALAGDIDKVVLTGSAATGTGVLAALSKRAIPATVELSGNDATIVLADANIELVADAVAYGLRLNSSQTCIAPRRVIVTGREDGPVLSAILARINDIQPVQIPNAVAERVQKLVETAKHAGANVLAGSADPARFTPFLLSNVPADSDILKADIFAPVVSVTHASNDVDAINQVNASPYGLGAAIFGDPKKAHTIAAQLDTGFVTINDMIVPTADPRAPFGGRKGSGFGVTRGAEGLLAMTRPKTIFLRKGKFHPHLNPIKSSDLEAYSNLLIAMHSRGFTQRIKAFMNAVRGLSSHIKPKR